VTQNLAILVLQTHII